MFKLFVIAAVLAVAAAAPGYIAAPVVAHSVSSHSSVVAHPSPVVHAVHAAPVVHAVHAVPVVRTVHAAPVVHTVHAAPLIHHHAVPVVRTVHATPVLTHSVHHGAPIVHVH